MQFAIPQQVDYAGSALRAEQEYGRAGSPTRTLTGFCFVRAFPPMPRISTETILGSIAA